MSKRDDDQVRSLELGADGLAARRPDNDEMLSISPAFVDELVTLEQLFRDELAISPGECEISLLRPRNAGRR
jgi:hypothetical protein